MSQPLKILRILLSEQGVTDYAMEGFLARCTALWGEAWDVVGAGIVVGGAVVVPRVDYGAFLRGEPYGAAAKASPSPPPAVKAAIKEPPPPAKPEAKKSESARAMDPLKCRVCGKRMPSSAALKGHMKKHG